ncbi:MAG TPA: hypothetical protein VMU17_01485 [Elusimicrobiota bacterium]|nr:hypothetical protein [Elusimicrobiota bacterium]
MVARRLFGIALLIMHAPMRAASPAEPCAGPHPSYDEAAANHRYAEALGIMLNALNVTASERAAISIQPGLSAANDDRHADAEAAPMRIQVDPALFEDGYDWACQEVVHELTHYRHFASDRRALHDFFATPAGRSSTQWRGCDDYDATVHAPSALEQTAFLCLEDDALTPHSAAFEIEAVLAQAAASGEPLHPEDYDYLAEHAQAFRRSSATFKNESNEAYYLPSLKTEDAAIARSGEAYLRKTRRPE